MGPRRRSWSRRSARPPTDDTPGFTGLCRLVAPTYGGTSEDFATLDVTLPVTGGKPTLVVA